MQKTKVKQIMKKEVITANSEDLIKDVIKKLAENNISGLPVVDKDNTILGMISEKDILTTLSSKSRTLSMVFPSSHALGMTFQESINFQEFQEAMKEVKNFKVEKIMKKPVISIDENMTVAEAAGIMIRNNINRIPVVKDGKLIGIVTRGDIISGLSKLK